LTNIKADTFQTSVEEGFNRTRKSWQEDVFLYFFVRAVSACTSVNVFGAQTPQTNLFEAFFVLFQRRW